MLVNVYGWIWNTICTIFIHRDHLFPEQLVNSINPCFGLLVMSALDFKARVDPLVCFIACMQQNPQIHQHDNQAVLIQVLANKHWWRSRPGYLMDFLWNLMDI